MEENSAIKEAKEELDRLRQDKREERLAELILDSNAQKEYAREEGLEEGRKQEKLEIAKNMLNKGYEIEHIQEITGLTKEGIDNLK